VNCWDYVVSSYVPTLGALLNARRTYKPIAKGEAKALLAAVPRPHDEVYSYLPSTVNEIKTMEGVLPPELLLIPRQEDARIEGDYGMKTKTLLKRLPEATILHLACHGLQDAQDPLKSGFIMQDSTLTIEELMSLPLPRAFLAFLSACETAKGDKVSLGHLRAW
jgi:CHAT domain-containing protein